MTPRNNFAGGVPRVRELAIAKANGADAGAGDDATMISKGDVKAPGKAKAGCEGILQAKLTLADGRPRQPWALVQLLSKHPQRPGKSQTVSGSETAADSEHETTRRDKAEATGNPEPTKGIATAAAASIMASMRTGVGLNENMAEATGNPEPTKEIATAVTASTCVGLYGKNGAAAKAGGGKGSGSGRLGQGHCR